MEAQRSAPPILAPSTIGNFVMVRLLARLGADVNAADVDGHTPPLVSVMQDRYQCVVALLQLGAALT